MARTELPPTVKARGRRLATALRQERLDRGWTQEQLAGRVGWSLHTLTRLERGGISNPGVFVIADFAREMGVDLQELLDQAEGAGE